MKTNTKERKRFMWNTLDIPHTNPNLFSPLNGKAASLGGKPNIDTKFIETNMREVKTTRLVSSTFTPVAEGDTYTAFRACDSYPVLVNYNTIALNIGGVAWNYDSSSQTYIPNAPAAQLEIECSNINAAILNRQYTDLVITNDQYAPQVRNAPQYVTTNWTRYFRSLEFNTKAFIKAFKKFERIMQWISLQQNTSMFAVTRANILIYETQRARFQATLAAFDKALGQLPVSKKLIQTYPALFNVEINGEGYTAVPAYVDVSLFDTTQNDGSIINQYNTLKNFCTLINALPLIFNLELVQEIEALPDLSDVCDHFFQSPDASIAVGDEGGDANDLDHLGWAEYCRNIVERFRETFVHLTLAIGAVATQFQPFLTAIGVVKDIFFTDFLVDNFSLSMISQPYAQQTNVIRSLTFAHNSSFTHGEGEYSRVVIGAIPLFNSFTPCETFSRNNILAYTGSDDPDVGFEPIVDISQLRITRLHSLNYIDDTGLNLFNYQYHQPCRLYPGCHYNRLTCADTNSIMSIPVLATTLADTACIYKIADLGVLRYLKSSLWAFTLDGDNTHIPMFNDEFTGWRSISYVPIDANIISNVGTKFGINSSVTAVTN